MVKYFKLCLDVYLAIVAGSIFFLVLFCFVFVLFCFVFVADSHSCAHLIKLASMSVPHLGSESWLIWNTLTLSKCLSASCLTVLTLPQFIFHSIASEFSKIVTHSLHRYLQYIPCEGDSVAVTGQIIACSLPIENSECIMGSYTGSKES